MTWIKSLLLLTTAPNPRRSPALRRTGSSLASPCGVWSTSPESTAEGGSWERQKFQDWEERRGFAHLQPARRKTDLSSQPWNSSSGARVIKSWTNCESPLKQIKSSVPPPPRLSPWALRRAEEAALRRAPVPALGRGSLLLEAAWHPGPAGRAAASPAAGAGRGAEGKRVGRGCPKAFVDQQNPSVSRYGGRLECFLSTLGAPA